MIKSIAIMPVKKALFTSLLVLLSVPIFAAQLIDKIPSKLEGNWSICIHFEESKPECNNQSNSYLSHLFEKAVYRFVYQKEFIISSDLQTTSFGIWLGAVDDVDEVRINGHLVGKTGSFPPHFQSGFRYQRLYLIPSIFLNYNQFNQLKIKTFSSINSAGLNDPPIVIDDFFEINRRQQLKENTYTIAISALLLLTLIQMFYYFMVKDSNETIYLSTFLLAFAVIAFTRSQTPLNMGLDLSSIFKTEIFMLATGMVAFTFYIFRFFDLEIRKLYVSILIGIGLLGIMSIIFPDPMQIRYIGEIAYWLIIIFSLFTIGSAVVISTRKRRKYSLIIGLLCIFGWIVLCYDAASQSSLSFIPKLPLLPFIVPITATVIGICMALAITHKYWQIFKGATYDHLTGTLLRPAFFQRLSEEIQRSQKSSSLLLVSMINIQEVKKISASYGQNVGNRMLLIISESLTKLLKPFDLICHFSDDEFCIATNVESRRDAEKYLAKIHHTLVNTQQIVGKETEIFIGAKLGGVIYNPDQHLSVSQLLQDANYGLARAKNQNNNDYVLMNNPTITA